MRGDAGREVATVRPQLGDRFRVEPERLSLTGNGEVVQEVGDDPWREPEVLVRRFPKAVAEVQSRGEAQGSRSARLMHGGCLRRAQLPIGNATAAPRRIFGSRDSTAALLSLPSWRAVLRAKRIPPMPHLLPYVTPFLLAATTLAQTGQNINHALTGTATQSADHPSYPTAGAGRLIDGNRNGNWLDNASNITAVMAQPWWQVTLAAPSLVHEVVVYCRADVNQAPYMSDLLLEVKSGSTVLWSQMACTGGGHPIRGGFVRFLLPPGGFTCDTVRLSRPNATNSVISLAEVEVVQIAPITPVNWAIYGTATQSTTTTPWPAGNALDGNTDSFANNNSCSMSSVNGGSGADFWEASVRRRPYDEIKLWPTTYLASMGPLYVRTFDGPTTVQTILVSNPPNTGPSSVLLSGADVDRVRVFRNSFSSPVMLAEVEVINYSALDAEAKPFGIGCLGSAGVPTLRPTSPPTINANFDVLVGNMPSAGIGVLISGLSRTLSGALPLPFDLVSLGASGCQLYTSLELTQVVVATAGNGASSFAVPNHAALIGFEMHQQAAVLDGPANPLGLTLSNALRVRLGLGF